MATGKKRNHHNPGDQTIIVTPPKKNPDKKNCWQRFCKFCHRICQPIAQLFCCKKSEQRQEATSGKTTTPGKQQNGAATQDETKRSSGQINTATTAGEGTMLGEQQIRVSTEDDTNRNGGKDPDAEQELLKKSSNEQATKKASMDAVDEIKKDDGSHEVEEKVDSSSRGQIADMKNVSRDEPSPLSQNMKESSKETPLYKAREHPSGNKTGSPEKPVHSYSSKEEEIDKTCKGKESESLAVANNGFEHSSEKQQKGDLQQEINSESQTQKIFGTDKQARLTSRIDERKMDAVQQGVVNEDNKNADVVLSQTTENSIGQKVASAKSVNKKHKRTDTRPPERNESIIVQEVDIQVGFSTDDRYTDDSSPKTSHGSAEQMVGKQANVTEEEKYAETSPPKTSKSGTGEKVFKKASSSKDDKSADDSSPKPSHGSAEQKVGKQTNFTEEDKYTETSPSKTSKSGNGEKIVKKASSSKDDKSTDTSLPKTAKSSIEKKAGRQACFNKDDIYANTDTREKDANQASFSKDDKHKDTTPPKKTKETVGEKVVRQASCKRDDDYIEQHPEATKSSVGHTLEGQRKARPSSSIFTKFSSIVQAGQLLSKEQQEGAVKQEGINKNENSTEPSNTDINKNNIGQAPKEQLKGVHKQDKSSAIHGNTRLDPTEFTVSSSGQASIP